MEIKKKLWVKVGDGFKLQDTCPKDRKFADINMCLNCDYCERVRKGCKCNGSPDVVHCRYKVE